MYTMGRYVVLPALMPDIASVYDAYFAAFAGTPITIALFPSATPAQLKDASSDFRQNHTGHVIQYWNFSNSQYTLKCIDTETGEVVGMALWDVYVKPSDWKKGGVEWLEGEQRTRAERLVMPLWDAREKLWLNERYIYLHVMAVHPSHQRKGIGKLLTDWGIGVARQAGLPVYLEASGEGVALYEKMGFRRLKEEVVHKGEDLGERHGDTEVPLMVWVESGGEARLPKAVQYAL